MKSRTHGAACEHGVYGVGDHGLQTSSVRQAATGRTQKSYTGVDKPTLTGAWPDPAVHAASSSRNESSPTS